MKVNTAELINQVEWLLNQMDQGQILRVFSYANRMYCQSPTKASVLQPSEAPHGNQHLQNDQHKDGK